MDLSDRHMIFKKDASSSQEPSLHDSSLIITDTDQDKDHGLVPTSEIGTLYQVEEDPARPPLQVPVYLFANTSIEEVGTKVVQTHVMASHDPSSSSEMLFAHDDMKVQIIPTMPSHMESPQGSPVEGEILTEEGVEMPQFLRTIEELNQKSEGRSSQQHVITIIRDDEENLDQEEENVSEAMLRRFVVDAGGMHSLNQDDMQKSEGEAQDEQEVISLAQDGGLREQGVTTSGHQVIIFSSSHDVTSSTMSNFVADVPMSKEIEVALNQNNESTSPSSTMKAVHDHDGMAKDAAVQCSLDMQFEVVAEIATQEGEVFMREITTQTRPAKKTRTSRKRKLKSDGTGDQDALEDFEFQDSKRFANMEEKRFKCTKCNLRFHTQDRLDVHVRCHRDYSRLYTCYFCDHTESQWAKMYRHLFQHGVEKPHKCVQCNFTCINRSDLTSHMAVHSKTKDWNCTKCKRPFKHRRNMVAHLRTCPGLDDTGKPQKTETEEKFICEVCNKQLCNKKNLEKHMEIHNDIKPFVCDQCGHSTRLKESLIMHKRLHTGEKPFKCDICDYATPDKSSLRRHKRTHSNDRPYKCQFCTYRCIQKHCLSTHIRRKHTGEQFVCGLCHYATHDRYGLNQHFKRHQNLHAAMEKEAESKETLDGDKPTSTSTLLMLPSGSVIKKTVTGKDTLIEEASKSSTQIHNLNQVLLHIDSDLTSDPPPKADEHSESNDVTQEESSNSNKNSLRAIELSRLETDLLQQIQQPGDEVYLQPTGEIVVRRRDGHLLIIQQQDPDEDEIEELQNIITVDEREYLTSAPSSAATSPHEEASGDDNKDRKGESEIVLTSESAVSQSSGVVASSPYDVIVTSSSNDPLVMSSHS